MTHDCRRWLALRLLLALVALLGAAQAQQPRDEVSDLPLLSLSTFTPRAGEELVLSAAGLEPGVEYALEFAGPEETLQDSATADAAGTFDYRTSLDAAGQWQVTVSGPELQPLRLRLNVAAEPRAPATQEGQSEPQPETTPETEPEQDAPAPETPAEPQPETPAEAQPEPAAPAPGAAPDDFAIEDGALVARANGKEAWRLAFPPDSGETRGLAQRQGVLYLGHGNSLLAVQPETGAVRARWLLPGQVTALEEDGAALLVSASAGAGARESFTLRGGALQEPVRFGSDPAVYGWLRQEAEVADPEARLAQDPTNPWLQLAVGRALEGSPLRAERYFQAAVAAGESFYDLAGLARELADAGQLELAGEAMDKALRDFAARGYEPRLLSPGYHQLYTFPLEPFEAALAADDRQLLRFWAPWLEYFATPNAPEVRAALEAYAERLRTSGDEQRAAELRVRLAASRPAAVAGALENTALSLGRSGWFVALALLVAFVALHLVLMAKYRWAQQVNLERRRLLNKPVSPASGLMLMRYYSFTEKLVLLLLLLAALLSAALAAWAGRGELAAPGDEALGSGTFASAAAQRTLAAHDWRGPRGAFVEGYAAKVVGAEGVAASRYRAAENDAGALNNLGALLNDEGYYRQALSLVPGFPEARYNLGEAVEGFAFARDYRPGEALLAVPSERDLQLAAVGRWDNAVGAMFRNPWAELLAARPAVFSLPAWTALVILYLLLVLITVVWLFVPRMRWVAQAPRSALYHLLAVLVPGSGLADEMWGFLLLVPWAVAGLDAVAEGLGWPFGYANGFTLFWDLVTLAVVYLINLVAVVVEYLSYRRRMRALRRDNPSLAQEFGLIRG